MGNAVRRTIAFSLLVASAGAGIAVGVAGRTEDFGGLGFAAWILLVGGFVASEVFGVHVEIRGSAHTFSLNELPLVIALFWGGGLELIAARILGGFIVVAFLQRQALVKLVFNMALFLFEAGIAVSVFHLIAADLEPGVRNWLAAFGATAAANFMAALAIQTVIGISSGRRDRSILGELLFAGLISSIATTSLALITVSMLRSDSRSIALVLVLAAVLFTAYRGYASLRQKYANLRHLYDFTRTLARSTEFDPAIKATLSEAREALRASRAELYLVETNVVVWLAENGDLETRPVLGSDEPDLVHTEVVSQREPVLISSGTKEPFSRRYLNQRGFSDCIAAPMLIGDQVIGSILVADRLGDVSTFDEEELRVFETLANHASISLANGRLIDRLRREAAERAHEARHDQLTSLGNRRLFIDRVGEAIQSHTRATDRSAVLLLDLNRFKDVNDSLGHHWGDMLLVEVAGRLRSILDDVVSIARLGGDEFAVLLPNVGSLAEAQSVGHDIARALEVPFSVQDLDLGISAAIGIAIWPDHGQDAATLLRHADIAMYAAKTSAENIAVYDLADDHAGARWLSMAADLRQAISDEALSVVYQPKADLSTADVHGVEALVRWTRGDQGPVPPSEFVPMAENLGLIRPLTSYVLRTVLKQSRAWTDAGLELSVAVNLSARSLLDQGLPGEVDALLRETGVPAHRLTLEVTESHVMTDPARTIAVLNRLRALGVQLSVDDFGTGYSSLSYLKRLPVQEVKIDRSFILDVATNTGDAAIVRSIIDLARNLGLSVVAEGIEDQTTWDTLRALGCDSAQGYHLARPMPAAQLQEWLSERRSPALLVL